MGQLLPAAWRFVQCVELVCRHSPAPPAGFTQEKISAALCPIRFEILGHAPPQPENRLRTECEQRFKGPAFTRVEPLRGWEISVAGAGFEALPAAVRARLQTPFPGRTASECKSKATGASEPLKPGLSGCSGGARVSGAPANWLSGQLPSSRYHWCDRHENGLPPATATKFFKALRW